MGAYLHDLENFPFTSGLSLYKLEKFWEEKLSTHPGFDPELFETLRYRSDEEKHTDKELLERLMTVVFPHAMMDTVASAAYKPFETKPFYGTQAFHNLFSGDARSRMEFRTTHDEMVRSCTVMAYLHILKKFYLPDLRIQYPMSLTTIDKETHLEHVYNCDINTRFVDIELNDELPPLSDATLSTLLNNLEHPDLWVKTLPPEMFHFKGFTVSTFTDVTIQEMRSAIKFYLLKKDAVTCGENFLTIQNKIRSILQLPDLSLGLVFFDPSNKIISDTGMTKWNSLIVKRSGENACDYFAGSEYHNAFSRQQPVVIGDMNHQRYDAPIEKGLREKGIRNLAILPLIKDKQVIGILELASKLPDRINHLNMIHIHPLLPMFTAAVDRVLGDIQLEVRATIQKECTAIHPSVEWRFLEAGYEVVRGKHAGKKVEMPQIRFENVYPLYGMSDVRGSSELRNQTVREDLMKNLHEASHVLQVLHKYRTLPVLDEIKYRIDQEVARLESGFVSGDEAFIMDFLTSEVNPALRFIASDDKVFQPVISDYFDLMDPELGIIYDKRKNFENSLTLINHRIATFIEHAEGKAQEILPHYFEKYKTDGIEYNLYLGNALLKEKRFDPLYLKNFRLWQLILMCEIGIHTREHRDELAYPLEITQLILVHSQPLTIHFRKDEKRFDVDGAYNIRYEIIKKRIDKAHIKGSRERLTQPGKVVIVYNQEKEAQEYQQYISYLRSLNYVSGETERLELEDLQGAKGLKALRITIDQNAILSREEQDLFNDIHIAIPEGAVHAALQE